MLCYRIPAADTTGSYRTDEYAFHLDLAVFDWFFTGFSYHQSRLWKMFTITAGEEQRCEALSIHFVKLRSCTVAFPDPDPPPKETLKTKSMFSVGVGACLIAARRMLTRVMSADEEKACN